MPDATESIEALEAQMTAISDTENNLSGLVEKSARIQAELLDAGFEEFSQAMGEPFSALSNAVEKLKALHHDIELERNRIRNEQ